MKSSLDFKLDYEKTDECASYPVIIVAAGSASRMKGIDKLAYKICGIPVLARTIFSFDKSKFISEIIVVTREDKISEYEAYKDKFGFSKKFSVIIGGDSREESVLNGIKAVDGKYEKVLIQDAARPLITEGVINRVCKALQNNDSVTCGVKERNSLVSIQTPQGVSVRLFIESALKNDLSRFTDDTSVVEAVGAITQIVEGDYKNIKITTPEDLKLAQMYLEE